MNWFLCLWRNKSFSLKQGGERIFLLLLVRVRWQSMPQSLQNNSKRQTWSYLTDKKKGSLPNILVHDITTWHSKKIGKKKPWWFNYGWKYSCLDTAERPAVPVSSCSHRMLTTSKHSRLTGRWRFMYGPITTLRSEHDLNDVTESWCNSYMGHMRTGSHRDRQCHPVGLKPEFPCTQKKNVLAVEIDSNFIFAVEHSSETKISNLLI